MMADDTSSVPLAWTAVEPGWRVRAAGGAEVGRVQRTLGDPEADIFDGFEVGTGLLGARMRVVRWNDIEAILPGEVRLRIGIDDLR
jgi:hypothetical protein